MPKMPKMPETPKTPKTPKTFNQSIQNIQSQGGFIMIRYAKIRYRKALLSAINLSAINLTGINLTGINLTGIILTVISLAAALFLVSASQVFAQSQAFAQSQVTAQLQTSAQSQASAQSIPPYINYQGRLTDQASGAPVNGAKSITFSLYEAATGGTPIYSQTQQVKIVNGAFSVYLGKGDKGEGNYQGEKVSDGIPAAVFTEHSARYLGIKMADSSSEMAPRQLMASVAYAYKAESAERAGEAERIMGKMPGETNGLATLDENGTIPSAQIPGIAIDSSGKIGIGTKSPQAMLDVAGQIRAESVTHNYCYAYSGAGHDMYSATWTPLNGLPACTITTFGRPLKVTMDFSVYGIQHGGIRLVMDGSTIFGKQPTYGFDWVIPAPDNAWTKRNIVRVITGIPAGTHSFMVQIRAQSDGSRFYIHAGDEAQNYCGFHLLIEEL
jgi:hypothetical protein